MVPAGVGRAARDWTAEGCVNRIRILTLSLRTMRKHERILKAQCRGQFGMVRVDVGYLLGDWNKSQGEI